MGNESSCSSSCKCDDKHIDDEPAAEIQEVVDLCSMQDRRLVGGVPAKYRPATLLVSEDEPAETQTRQSAWRGDAIETEAPQPVLECDTTESQTPQFGTGHDTVETDASQLASKSDTAETQTPQSVWGSDTDETETPQPAWDSETTEPQTSRHPFTVRIVRTGEHWKTLGLHIRPGGNQHNCLIVDEIPEPSLISEWNASHDESERVHKGHQIVSVNGCKCDDGMAMLELIKANGIGAVLLLTVQ